MGINKASALIACAVCGASVELVAASLPDKKYLIDQCKPNDVQSQGGSFSYSVTILEPSTFARIVTILESTGTGKSEAQVQTVPTKTTYKVTLDVPATFAVGKAKLITRLDSDKARECDVRITQGGPGAAPVKVGPFNPWTTSLSGLVTDDKGAAVPGAAVMVSSKDTGVVHNIVTDANGRYSLKQLPVGKYIIEAKGPGLTSMRREVELTAGIAIANADIKVKERG